MESSRCLRCGRTKDEHDACLDCGKPRAAHEGRWCMWTEKARPIVIEFDDELSDPFVVTPYG